MELFHTVESIFSYVEKLKLENKSIGFVPSMGALHMGHISLVNEAKQNCDVVITSIFVNPTQFNNLEDLEKYPRTLESDVKKLAKAGCDVVFTPSINEIYPSDYQEIDLDLGSIKNVMEDALRPGHFKGVVNVVNRLFDIVKPNKAYFGLKDFQQVAVIKHMTKKLKLSVEIIACPTIREKSGLAMSSRNLRLSEMEKENALIIYNSMIYAKSLVNTNSPSLTKKLVTEFFNKGKLKVDYIEIVDPISLADLENEWVKDSTICIAAFCGEIRLIDNMQLC